MDIEEAEAVRHANQAAINALPRNLGGHKLSVRVSRLRYGRAYPGYTFDGFYNGKIEIGTFHQEFQGENEGSAHGVVSLSNCNCSVAVAGFYITGAAHCAIYAENCPSVHIFGNTFGGVYEYESGKVPGGAPIILINSHAVLGSVPHLYDGAVCDNTFSGATMCLKYGI